MNVVLSVAYPLAMLKDSLQKFDFVCQFYGTITDNTDEVACNSNNTLAHDMKPSQDKNQYDLNMT